MKKHFPKSYLAVFILLFCVPVISFSLFGKYFDSVNYEKREAAEKPEFSFETIGEFPQKYEKYYNDTLPFRSQMIEINALVNYHIFRQSPVEKVVIGKDGWLFYNPQGKDGDPIADYRGDNLLSQQQLAQIADNLTTVNNTLKANGKKFVVFIAPNKESMYGNKYLPSKYANQNTYTTADQVVDYLQQFTDVTVVYPKKQLQSAIKNDAERDYYYKTDTHWNSLGAYVGATELLKALDISMPEISKLKTSVATNVAGDLAGMMGMSKHLNYDTQFALSGYTDKTTEGPVVDDFKCSTYITDGAREESLLMIRDSYATAMYPYISSQFSTSQFVHIDNYTANMISTYNPNIVVLETVERYLGKLQTFSVK